MDCDQEPATPHLALALAGERAAPVPLGDTTPGSDPTSWVFWYPTWEAWKFQRTLAYWISVMYLEGSLLFIAGAAFALAGAGEWGEAEEHALEAVPYFVGGICFTVGSYAGLLEVVNAPNMRDQMRAFCLPCSGPKWRRLREFVSWEPVAGYTAYLVGALFFNVDTLGGFSKLTDVEGEVLVWGPAILGAAGFVVGSALECHLNKVWRCELGKGAWWLSATNFLGSLCFLVAGIAGFCRVEGFTASVLVDFMYLVGSVGFMVGSLCTMWLWKCEQYGLGFIPEMNVGARVLEPDESVLSLHAEYGCGRASAWQLPFLTMYLVNATASVLLIGLAIRPSKPGDERDRSYDIFEAVLNFALSHGVMLLGSVVHHVPTARPHSWLLIYMRVVLALYTVNSWLRVHRQLVA